MECMLNRSSTSLSADQGLRVPFILAQCFTASLYKNIGKKINILNLNLPWKGFLSCALSFNFSVKNTVSSHYTEQVRLLHLCKVMQKQTWLILCFLSQSRATNCNLCYMFWKIRKRGQRSYACVKSELWNITSATFAPNILIFLA